MYENTMDKGLLQDHKLTLEVLFCEIVMSFILWGTHIALACYSIPFLWDYELNKPIARQCLSRIAIFMIAASIVVIILLMKFCVTWIPIILADVVPLSLSIDHEVGVGWLSILKFSLAGLIVICRAWALWSSSHLVCWALGSVISLAIACTMTSTIIVTVNKACFIPAGPVEPSTVPSDALRSLLFFLIMATNMLAIFQIRCKAWVYRKDKESVTTNNNRNGAPYSAYYKSASRAGHLSALLVIGITIIFVMSALSPSNKYALHIFGSDVITEISAVYPTVIISLFQKYIAQEDTISTEDDACSSWGNSRQNGADRANETYILPKTIQHELLLTPIANLGSIGFART